MENDPAVPDAPKQNSPAQTRDPLIRYSVFAALGCAGVCMIFTILYVFSYSLDSTLSFERHFDSYLASGNTSNLSTVLGLHMAQNRMFLQSCGMVAGIFFAFLGLALFLVGIQGSIDATGKVTDYSNSMKRLAPGGIILLASMIFVGVSAMHPIELKIGPTSTGGSPASAAAEPAPQPAPQPATQPATQSSAQPASQPAPQPAPQPTTQSQLQPAPAPATTAHLAPQSAQVTPPTPPAPSMQAAPPPAPQPAVQPAPRPAPRPVLVPVDQSSVVSPIRIPPIHRFQP
jgi:hypothetical protein